MVTMLRIARAEEGAPDWLQSITQPPLLYALIGAALLLLAVVALLIRGGRRTDKGQAGGPPAVQAQAAPASPDALPSRKTGAPDVPEAAAPLVPCGPAVTARLCGTCNGHTIDCTLHISGEALLGREPDCDLPLPSPRVSRRHMRLVVQEGALWAENLSHSTLTCVEGELLLKPRMLHSGDELLLGETRLNVTIGEEHK